MRSDIAEAALSFVGTPFAHQGRIPGKGLDCVGVWCCALRACGIQHDDWTRYPKFPRAEELTRRMEAQFDVVDDMQIGDAVQMRKRRHPRHLAVYIGNGRIVHTEDGRPVSVDVVDPQRVFRVYRVRG